MKFAGSWRPFRKYIHTCVLEKLVGFVASWLDFVLCIFIAVCLVVIRHRFYTKNTTLWVVECDKFETYLFAFRRSHNTLRIQKTEKNRPLLIIIPFKIYLENFPIQKLNFPGNLLLANRCSIFSNDKHQEKDSVKLKINKCWLQLFVPIPCSWTK